MLKIHVIMSDGIKKWDFDEIAYMCDFYKADLFDVIAQYHKKRKFMKYLKAVCHGGIKDWDLYALLTYHWKHIFKKIGMPSKAIDLADYLMANAYENHPEMDVERDTAERID